ncbi:Uncharacterised protein [Mycobacteroides abscessus subsp. abscessus]|nr:Uncharacterised protein [Mycobacteroides abscessus subsp. abscessus]
MTLGNARDDERTGRDAQRLRHLADTHDRPALVGWEPPDHHASTG